MREALITVSFWTIVVMVPISFALPPALREKSWKRFGIALVLSVVGLILPVFVFMASAFLVPDWKGGCHHGWLDCFHSGKLVLLPFVLWASSALYAVEVLRVQNRIRPWIVFGISLGALVSGVCLLFGLVVLEFGRQGDNPLFMWLIVPLYVAVWYAIRAVQLARASSKSWGAHLVALSSSLPFWIASVVLSRRCYLALPDQPPDCFIVTAAMRGHVALVGPFTAIRRNGQPRIANRQLMIFWCIESIWSDRLPRSHNAFRRMYNRLGPEIARRIKSPFLADIIYLMLTPVELIGRLALVVYDRTSLGQSPKDRRLA